MKRNKKTLFIEHLEILIKWRHFIIRNAAIVTMTAIIISLLLTQKFTATATMLPPSSDQDAMMGLLSGSIAGKLSGLSSISGVLPGVATPSDLYAAIMSSGRIKGKLIDRFDLMTEFRTKTLSDASDVLDEITKFEVTPEGIIVVSVIYKNRYFAADLANAFLEELDNFNNETAMTTGKKYRIFIEKRLMATLDTLTYDENTLKTFQEKHRTIALNIEIEKAIATIAELKSRIILLEVQRGVLSPGSSLNNPQVYSLNREIKELQRQLAEIEMGSEKPDTSSFGAGYSIPFSELPEISLEYFRLLRDVKVQEAIYELMTQQYEQAKIMELKDTPTVQILDYASPPDKRSFPKRSIIALIALFCSITLSVLYIFTVEYVQKEPSREDTVRKIFKIIYVLRNDIHKIFHKPT